jgi:type I restriction enzyme, S subunit
VARIEELAARIEEARGLRQQAVEEAEILLGAEEMQVWPDTDLDEAPALSEVTNFLSRGRQSKQGESDHYLIKTQHVQMGKYVESDMTLAPDIALKVRAEAAVRHGDVLIACSAAGCLGRVAYYADSGRTASTDTHVAIARADQSRVLNEYLSI